MKVRFARQAEADLAGIGDRIAMDNPARAASFVRELRAAAKGLNRFPWRFPLMEGRESTGIRRRLYRSYLIFYLVVDRQVIILRLIHASRDYAALLPGG